MKRKIFGTDGIRGPANLYPMVSEVALVLGRAIAYQARKRSKRPRIIVGKDTRLSCYMIESAIVSGICSMGADALMTGPIPTPGIAHLTVDMRCDAGVMITASHNPYEDNGLKVFGPDGFKLSDKEEFEIEQYILEHYTTDKFVSPDDDSYPVKDLIGKAIKLEDARGRYIAHVKSVFPKNMDLTGMKIALDCANGAAYKVAPAILEELGAEVFVMSDKPNGTNINDFCGAINPQAVANFAATQKCDIGIALDGDADRVVITDGECNVLDGDVLLAHLASEYLNQPNMVATTMSNAGLVEFLSQRGGSVVRSKVGDRYVIDRMREENIMFGGENSGHIIFFDHSTTGDGMVAALKLLELLKKNNKTVLDLSEEIKMYPQIMVNVEVKDKRPLKDAIELQKTIQEVYNIIGPTGRLLVRYSGTEPKLRIMVEYKDEGLARDLAERIADVAKTTL